MRSVRQYVVVAGLLLAGVFAFPASASTGANFVETQQPFSQMLFNPCTHEPFLASGRIHSRIYFSVTVDGKTHMGGEINLQGVEGLTLSGVRYVVQRNDSNHMIFDSDVQPFNSHVTFKEHYVRLKSDGTLEKNDDFYEYFRFQLTVNANGVMTVDRLESDFECN
jgi:hypothetical protein